MRTITISKTKKLRRPGLIALLILISLLNVFGDDKVKTKVIVRAISKDAKVLSSKVGGALITIKEIETGKILAQGVQKGGSGDTELIMKKPQQRGGTIYNTEDAAKFEAELELDKPSAVEITAEGPLNKPHALQKASKTMLLVPGRDIVGEGVIIELHGFIVDILPAGSNSLKPSQPFNVEASVTML